MGPSSHRCCLFPVHQPHRFSSTVCYGGVPEPTSPRCRERCRCGISASQQRGKETSLQGQQALSLIQVTQAHAIVLV